MKNWSLLGRKHWRKPIISRFRVRRGMYSPFSGSSAPAAEGCFTPSSTTESIARAKHAQGSKEESSGNRPDRTLYAPAAERPSRPAATMPSSVAMPAGKRPTGKAKSEKCRFGIFHLNVTVGNNLLLQIDQVVKLAT